MPHAGHFRGALWGIQVGKFEILGFYHFSAYL